jgi:iron complex outermembrane recepter protein
MTVFSFGGRAVHLPRATLLALVSMGLMLPATSWSQDTLEEIIVTASKREESMQDSPIAVTAITGEQLLRAGVVDPDTLAELVPNMDVNSEANRDGLIIVIRGIAGTDVRNGADPTTAFHVDGNYVPRLSGANAYFFDTERVEILRGPQGTLYGRNSTSGVVNVITRKPVLGEFSTNGEITVGNFQSFIAQGGVSVPLSETLAFRGAFMRNSHDGYRNNKGPGSVGIVTNGDDADETAYRAHLLWSPSDSTSVLFTGEWYRRGGVGQVLSFTELAFNDPGTSGAVPSPNPADASPLNTQGQRDNRDRNFRLELNHSMNWADVFYQAAYRNHRRFYVDDNDGTALVVNSIPATGSIVETTESETYSHEVRLTSNNDSAFQWILGGFYMKEEIDGDFQVFLPRDPSVNFGPGGSGFDQQIVQFIDRGLTNESTAAFLNTTYQLTDRVRLTAGLRWTQDDKDKGGRFGNTTTGSVFNVTFHNFALNRFITPSPPFPIPQVSTPRWTETTWKVGLDFNLSDTTMAYATAGTGYKSGGWNRGSQGATTDGTLFTFQPETVTSYEIGVKSDLLEGRARLNVAAFLYDYEDMQVASIFTAPSGIRTNITNNAASSTVSGLEAEGTMLFGESGTATIALGYLNTEFDTFVGFVDDLTGGTFDVAGNDLPRAPAFNATVGLIPTVWHGMNGSWTPQVQFHYETDSFFSPLNRPGPEERDAYTKTNLTLMYEHDDGVWYAEAFIYNLENDDVKNSGGCGAAVGSASAAPNPIQNCTATYEPPRTFGIRFGFRM